MRVTLVLFGSRGDVHPHTALALGLEERGHSVVFATHREFEPFLRGYGVEFAPLAGDVLSTERELLSSPPGADRVAYMTRWMRVYRQIREEFEADVRRVCAGTDAIVHNNFALIGARVASEIGVPSAMTVLQPLGSAFVWPPERRLYDAGYAILAGFSPVLAPPEADLRPSVHVTGYWFLDAPPGWTPPEALVRFLEAGPPPVVVGVGSVPDHSAEELTRHVLDALRTTGRRGVLLTGAAGLRPVERAGVLSLDAVPFDWLLPRSAALVYHGGVGTILESLRAGVPFVCVAYHAEHRMWGARLQELGAGPGFVPREALTARSLTEAMNVALTDEGIRRRVADLGTRVRAEDGVGVAVRAFEEVVRSFRRGYSGG